MIALGMSHQTSHKVFGHYIIHNVTKFKNYIQVINSLLAENHHKNILIKAITAKAMATSKLVI